MRRAEKVSGLFLLETNSRWRRTSLFGFSALVSHGDHSQAHRWAHPAMFRRPSVDQSMWQAESSVIVQSIKYERSEKSSH